MSDTCTNCGIDVDKDPTVLCDECGDDSEAALLRDEIEKLRSAKTLTTEELEQLLKLNGEIVQVRANWNVFEWYCEACGASEDPGKLRKDLKQCCSRTRWSDEPIFVGKHSADGDAWEGLGILLDILERARPLLRKMQQESLHG